MLRIFYSPYNEKKPLLKGIEMNLNRIIDPLNSHATLDTMTALLDVADASLFDSKAFWSQYKTFTAKSAGNGVIHTLAGIGLIVGGVLVSVRIKSALEQRKNSEN